MVRSLQSLFGVTAVVCASTAAAWSKPEVADDVEGATLLRAAQRSVASFHAGEPRSGAMLRVVYFHPHDRDPLPGYTERLDRVLTDVSAFYREGLRRFGIESEGLPLEREAGRVKLHLVRGAQPASHYKHESGDETEREIRAALRGKLDLDREHVLILYALCRVERDGRHIFDAPYYGKGGSSQRAGLCHAADCSLLDTQHFTNTTRKIVYTEHYYPRVEQTLAKFNTWYIGGIAHEVGHGLGLPHDVGSDEERSGISLMGWGNHAYRQELWGGGKPTILSRASALQLMSHPLITGSNRGRWETVGVGIDDVIFARDRKRVRVEGTTAGTTPSYAVAVSLFPAKEKNDRGRKTYLALTSGGRFEVVLPELSRDTYDVSITSMHVNGATTSRHLQLEFDAGGQPDVVAANSAWAVVRAERAVTRREPDAHRYVDEEINRRGLTDEAARKLAVLRQVVKPSTGTPLAAAKGDRIYLSDVAWFEAEVGWGKPARNHCSFDEQIGVFAMVNGRFFDKALYAHSPSRYAFDLEGGWETFSATVGLRDGAQQQGSAIFIVRGDGRELHRSRVLRAGASAGVSVDVRGVKRLELVAEGGEGHPHNSWAIWAEPQLRR